MRIRDEDKEEAKMATAGKMCKVQCPGWCCSRMRSFAWVDGGFLSGICIFAILNERLRRAELFFSFLTEPAVKLRS